MSDKSGPYATSTEVPRPYLPLKKIGLVGPLGGLGEGVGA